MMDSINIKAVDTFLVEKLGIKNWQELKKENPIDLIKTVNYRYITHPEYAFQNLGFASVPPEQRKAPTRQCSIKSCLTTLQGMCIAHNYFLAVLFKSMGFDAFVVGSTVSLLPMPLNHPLCIVRLEDGLWLVDMGMGSVFHQPIPLHQLPVSFTVAGFTCEYRKSPGDVDLYQRVHVTGDPVKGVFDSGPEEVRYHFTLEPMQYENFDPAMKTIFTDSETSFFLNTLYSFRYLTLDLDAQFNPKHFTAVIFIGTSLITFSEKEYEKILFSSYEEMESTFVKYFPQVPLEHYQQAVKYFKISPEKHG